MGQEQAYTVCPFRAGPDHLLSRVEEACRHDEEWDHLAATDFWAKLNQVLVKTGSDLYARAIQAKISTPQDTLDARHDMTKAKLEVMRLPPRRPRNQMRDSDLPSDIERVRHIFTGWRTYSTYWRRQQQYADSGSNSVEP